MVNVNDHQGENMREILNFQILYKKCMASQNKIIAVYFNIYVPSSS